MKPLKFFAALLLIWIMGSCETNGIDEPDLNLTKKNVQKSQPDPIDYDDCNTQTLWAGQDIPAGYVTTTVEDELLHIEVEAPAGYQQWDEEGNPMDEQIKVWVGTDLDDIPTAGCAPVNGKFPYNLTIMDSDQTTGEIIIPLPEGDKIYVVVHVDILTTIDDPTSAETAYAGDLSTGCNRWWNYYYYDKDCNPPPVADECFTAFATPTNDFQDATCFTDMDINDVDKGDNLEPDNFTEWGWSYGPINKNEDNPIRIISLPIYANGTDCKYESGERVGILIIKYNTKAGTAKVEYQMSWGSLYYMKATHLYVGNDILPSVDGDFTIDPESYGNSHDLDHATSDIYTIKGLSGDIYVVAQAEVCLKTDSK